MRAKSTRGYVLKVAIASASIGCASPPAGNADHPVGTVASPPAPAPAPEASATPSAIPSATPSPSTPPPSEPVGTVAPPPGKPDAAAPAPKPTGHKVGLLAPPPDVLHGPTVGTTAQAPDSPPPPKK